MAIKIGKQSEEGSFKMYKGVAALNVVAINPTKKELSELTGREIEAEPVYLGKDDSGLDTMRITVYAKTNPDAKVNNGINLLTSFSFILTKTKRVGQASGKVQVIDKYGRTAWATEEELANKTIPQYTNGPANIDANYRPVVVGEEQLVEFLIQWLNIPGPAAYKDGKWVMKDNPEDSEVSLNISQIFKGDVSELQGLVKLATNYAVKAAVGIRTTDEGKQYQAVFTRKFLKNAVTDYSKLDAAIKEFQNNGGAPNTEFSVLPLHENTVEATTFAPASNDMPFEAGEEDPWS